jgi:uncharacterized protein YhhL (DUF1145 family)
MRAIGFADSAQKRGKSAKICEFRREIYSFFFTQLGIMVFSQQANLRLLLAACKNSCAISGLEKLKIFLGVRH